MSAASRSRQRPFIERATARRHSPCRTRAARLGFTLVELLVAITIIGLLAGLVFGALQRAGGTAKIAHTKSTIAKLNASLMDRWDSYRNRRLPINPANILAAIKATNGAAYPYVQSQVGFGSVAPPPGGSMVTRRAPSLGAASDPLATPYNSASYPTSLQVSAVRLLAMRELMKFEMPQHFDEFIGNFVPATAPGGFTLRGTNVLTAAPPIATSYLAAVNTASLNGASFAQIKANDSAECLYLILTIGSTDSGLFGEQLPNQDIGDVDGDGLPEFQDAWPVALNSFAPKGPGNSPIDFLRWAPGFMSALQENPTIPNSYEFSVSHHDYFDPLKLDVPMGTNGSPRGFRLTPLIYSAGPDGQWALDYGPPNMDDPYDATGPLAGTATAGADDDLTNHDLDTRTGR